MKRCFHCGKPLGLATVSRKFWSRSNYWWDVLSFCSRRCLATFKQVRLEAAARERAALAFFHSKSSQ